MHPIFQSMCVVMPGCLFSALVVPSGASASGHENCHSDAVEPVPESSSCVLSKPGHLCSAAQCGGGDAWSDVMCVPSPDAAFASWLDCHGLLHLKDILSTEGFLNQVMLSNLRSLTDVRSPPGNAERSAISH